MKVQEIIVRSVIQISPNDFNGLTAQRMREQNAACLAVVGGPR